MSAKNFDRDLHFINSFIAAPGDSSSSPARTAAPLPRTDGVVYDDVGTIVRLSQSDVTIGASQWQSAGVIMRRPEVRGVYRIKGTNFSEGLTGGTVTGIGIAIAPASPTAATTGEVVPHWQIISTQVIEKDVDLTVCINNFGTVSSTDYSERDIIFFASLMDLGSATPVTWLYNLSVQRLSVGVPEYESKYR